MNSYTLYLYFTHIKMYKVQVYTDVSSLSIYIYTPWRVVPHLNHPNNGGMHQQAMHFRARSTVPCDDAILWNDDTDSLAAQVKPGPGAGWDTALKQREPFFPFCELLAPNPFNGWTVLVITMSISWWHISPPFGPCQTQNKSGQHW